MAKFLRSEQGFQLLAKHQVLHQMMDDWFAKGNIEYISRVEKSFYNGLNLNQLNKQDADHALQIWIPIYEHSEDMRGELA